MFQNQSGKKTTGMRILLLFSLEQFHELIARTKFVYFEDLFLLFARPDSKDHDALDTLSKSVVHLPNQLLSKHYFS